MHERVSLNGLSFPRDQPLAEDLAAWRAAGAARVGVHTDKLAAGGWAESLALLRDGPRVEYLVHRRMFELPDPSAWPADRERLRRTLDAAASLGAPVIYGTTGPAGGAGTLARALGPFRGSEVRIAFEVAPARHAAIHSLHTLRDTVAAARATGTAVCLDIRSCAGEDGLERTLAGAGDVLALVQVNDLLPGSDAFVVPGRGVAPVDRILHAVLELGYEGPFDIKLIGRPLDEVLAGAAYVAERLERWGVRAGGAGPS